MECQNKIGNDLRGLSFYDYDPYNAELSTPRVRGVDFMEITRKRLLKDAEEGMDKIEDHEEEMDNNER